MAPTKKEDRIDVLEMRLAKWKSTLGLLEQVESALLSTDCDEERDCVLDLLQGNAELLNAGRMRVANLQADLDRANNLT